MAVSEIHHIAMVCSSLERSTAFYSELLGYRATLAATVEGPALSDSLGVPEGTRGRIQYLQGPSQIGQIELIEWEGEPGTQPRRDHRDLGPWVLSLQVPADEIAAVYERACAMGADTIAAPMRIRLENFGYIQAFAVRDPDGTMVEFVALPTREEILAFRRGEEG